MSSGKLRFRCGPAMFWMPIISPSVAEPTRRRGPAWAIMRSGGGENFQARCRHEGAALRVRGRVRAWGGDRNRGGSSDLDRGPYRARDVAVYVGRSLFRAQYRRSMDERHNQHDQLGLWILPWGGGFSRCHVTRNDESCR